MVYVTLNSKKESKPTVYVHIRSSIHLQSVTKNNNNNKQTKIRNFYEQRDRHSSNECTYVISHKTIRDFPLVDIYSL